MIPELTTLTAGSIIFSAIQAAYPHNIEPLLETPPASIAFTGRFIGTTAFNTLSVYSIALGYYCTDGDPFYIDATAFGAINLISFLEPPNLEISQILHTTSMAATYLGLSSIFGALASGSVYLIAGIDSAVDAHDFSGIVQSGPRF